MTTSMLQDRLTTVTIPEMVGEEAVPASRESYSIVCEGTERTSTTIEKIDAPDPYWMMATLSRVRRVAGVPATWDNEGSAPRGTSLLASAVNLLIRLMTTQTSTTIEESDAPKLYWMMATLSRLKGVAGLPANWDNEGSAPTDTSLLASAVNLLIRLMTTWPENVPVPAVCPIAGGQFQFEWQLGKKYLEIQFFTPDTVAFLTEEVTQQGPIIISGEYPLSRLDQSKRLINWLIIR